MKSKQHIVIREFVRFFGSLGACCPTSPYSWVYTKIFEREKILALQAANGSYDATMIVPTNHPDFDWWIDNVTHKSMHLHPLPTGLEIASDVSLFGWGP